MATVVTALKFHFQVTPEIQACFDDMEKGKTDFVACLTPEQLSTAQAFFDSIYAFMDCVLEGVVCITDTHANTMSTVACEDSPFGEVLKQ